MPVRSSSANNPVAALLEQIQQKPAAGTNLRSRAGRPAGPIRAGGGILGAGGGRVGRPGPGEVVYDEAVQFARQPPPLGRLRPRIPVPLLPRPRRPPPSARPRARRLAAILRAGIGPARRARRGDAGLRAGGTVEEGAGAGRVAGGAGGVQHDRE
jgi:hypothetical protein